MNAVDPVRTSATEHFCQSQVVRTTCDWHRALLPVAQNEIRTHLTATRALFTATHTRFLAARAHRTSLSLSLPPSLPPSLSLSRSLSLPIHSHTRPLHTVQEPPPAAPPAPPPPLLAGHVPWEGFCGA